MPREYSGGTRGFFNTYRNMNAGIQEGAAAQGPDTPEPNSANYMGPATLDGFTFDTNKVPEDKKVEFQRHIDQFVAAIETFKTSMQDEMQHIGKGADFPGIRAEFKKILMNL